MSGYGLRVMQARVERGEQLCECGHTKDSHRERGHLLVVGQHGLLEEVPHPEHEPGIFHCGHPDCNCTIDARGP